MKSADMECLFKGRFKTVVLTDGLSHQEDLIGFRIFKIMVISSSASLKRT